LWGAGFAEEGAISRGFNPTQDIATDAAYMLIGRAGVDIKGELSIKVLVSSPQL
jgi:hypothetical protein